MAGGDACSLHRCVAAQLRSGGAVYKHASDGTYTLLFADASCGVAQTATLTPVVANGSAYFNITSNGQGWTEAGLSVTAKHVEAGLYALTVSCCGVANARSMMAPPF
jgi:hypothetical protein